VLLRRLVGRERADPVAAATPTATVMIEAYLDATAQAKTGYLGVAGYLLPKAQANKFGREWRDVLQRANATHFHASRWFPGAPPFDVVPQQVRDTAVNELIDIIRERTEVGVVAFLSEEEFREVTSQAWRNRHGNAYVFLVKWCLFQLRIWLDEKGDPRTVAFFFEAGDRYSKQANVHLNEIAADPEKRAYWRYRAHDFLNKSDNPVLQAADLLAYEYRRLFEQRQSGPPSAQIKPRGTLRRLISGQTHRYKAMWLAGQPLRDFVEKLKFATDR